MAQAAPALSAGVARDAMKTSRFIDRRSPVMD